MDLGIIPFNKRFRFETALPIQIQTKIQTIDPSFYFIQSKITNATINIIYVEKVELLPS